jgi:hypothetical protein
MPARFITFILISFFATGAFAQEDMFAHAKPVKNMKATVKAMNLSQVVLITGDDASQRYMGTDLPDELKRNGLHLTVDGEIGEIPANVRMLGTPFHIYTVRLTSAEQKKYKLPKRKYVLKK